MNVLAQFPAALWQIMLELSLWLFIGAFIAGLLKLFLPKGFIHRHAGSGSFRSIVKTSLLGVPLPLCSCGVLPATIGIKKDGAGNGAAVGFLISTPQTGVDSILVTASFLGWPLALFKVIAAFVTGILGGVAVQATEPKTSSLSPTETASPDALNHQHPPQRWNLFWDFSINDLIKGIYRYLAIGLLIAALITILFPANAFKDMQILQGIWGMLIMLLIATPLYVCTTGSVPIVASLIAAGLPVGSALVFLMAGPATNAATIAAILKQFGKRITAIYLGTVILGSIVFGLLFQSLGLSFIPISVGDHHEHTTLFMTILNTIAAIALTSLLTIWGGHDFWRWLTTRFKKSLPANEKIILQVSKMTCQNCVTKVADALYKDAHVSNVTINLDSGQVVIEGHHLLADTLLKRISDAGYPAKTKEAS